MKVGDKVYVEVEIISVKSELINTRLGWFDNSEAITQIPIQEGRWMMVSDYEAHWKKRFVVGKFRDKFIAFSDADDEESLKKAGKSTTPWKYAKEIPIKRKLTMQEIAEKFNEDVDNIEICTE